MTQGGKSLPKLVARSWLIVSHIYSVPLNSPGTVGDPGTRRPPGSAALRAELDARQEYRGAPRYRYVGHVGSDQHRPAAHAPVFEGSLSSHPSQPTTSARRFSGTLPPPNGSNRSIQGREVQDPLSRSLDSASAGPAYRDDERPQRRIEADSRPRFGRHADDAPLPRGAGPVYEAEDGMNRGRSEPNALYLDSRYHDRVPRIRNSDEALIHRQRDPSPAPRRAMGRQYDHSPEPRDSFDADPRSASRFDSSAPLSDWNLGSRRFDDPARPELDSRIPVDAPRFASSVVEQELAAMKQKIADLERLRALELSLYSESSTFLSQRNASPSPPLVPSHGYRDIRSAPRPKFHGDVNLRNSAETRTSEAGPPAYDRRDMRDERDDRDFRANSSRFAPSQPGPNFNEYDRDVRRDLPMVHSNTDITSRSTMSFGPRDRNGGLGNGRPSNLISTFSAKDGHDQRPSAVGRGQFVSDRQGSGDRGRTPSRGIPDRSLRGPEQAERSIPPEPQFRQQPSRNNRFGPALPVQPSAPSRPDYRSQVDRR